MPEITLPSLLVTSSKSQFRLRVHSAAWSDDCGRADRPGLVLLSATAADTSIKAARATLYSPDIEADFRIESDDTLHQLTRARYEDKPCSYQAAVAKLASGAVHLVALAKIPGLMPNLSDDHLWAELSGPRYSTPLLRPWVGWLKRKMIESGGISMAQGYETTAGVLTTTCEELDELAKSGVRKGYLKMSEGKIQ